MNIKDKIYKLGLVTLDELLLHRNVSKKAELTITEVLREMGISSKITISVNPDITIAFSEDEIADFYWEWEKAQK